MVITEHTVRLGWFCNCQSSVWNDLFSVSIFDTETGITLLHCKFKETDLAQAYLINNILYLSSDHKWTLTTGRLFGVEKRGKHKCFISWWKWSPWSSLLHRHCWCCFAWSQKSCAIWPGEWSFARMVRMYWISFLLVLGQPSKQAVSRSNTPLGLCPYNRSKEKILRRLEEFPAYKKQMALSLTELQLLISIVVVFNNMEQSYGFATPLFVLLKVNIKNHRVPALKWLYSSSLHINNHFNMFRNWHKQVTKNKVPILDHLSLLFATVWFGQSMDGQST